MPNLIHLPWRAAGKIAQLTDRGSAEWHYALKMFEAGALRIEAPHHMAAMLADISRWGEFGMISALNARRNPDAIALVDEDGEVTFAELDRSANAVANGLLSLGLRAGGRLALLARNHRWFLIALFGAAKVGARLILLNSEFSGPQIKEVVDREDARLIIYDDEYTGAVAAADPSLGRLRALPTNPDAPDEPSQSTDETLADLIARSNDDPPPRAGQHSKMIMLTSGTTGTPKGANRSTPLSLAPFGGVLSRVPLKAGEVTSLPAPMFHGLGFLHAILGIMLGSTLLLRRRFQPAAVLSDIEKHRVTAIVVVPVMLSRILDAYDASERKPDLSSLRIVFVSGSQLGGELATRAMRALGPVVYNLYASTEIALATIARPQDLSINPTTVGPVVKGVTVKLYDDDGREVPQGEVGRIFVGSTFPFEGYTGGGGKQIIDGLMSSGDVGYFDEHGLLYLSGRDDEMVVCGGENVFPAEVEDLISGHPEVVEATALGVEDDQWGHRLRAFVVKVDGSSVDEDAIKAYVKDNLARFKVPREVIFLDELPRNPTGKILKRVLAQHFP